MDIKIKLPKPENVTGTEIKSFVRQLELCVHHLSKSVDQMIENNELSEDSYVMYRFPFLKTCEEKDNYFLVHVDEEADNMQDIEIEIVKG